MQRFNTFFFIGLLVVILLISFSTVSIPFIYANKNFVSIIIAYSVLVVWFSCHVIYGFNLEENSVEKMRKNKSHAYIAFFFLPLILGWLLSSLLPIAVDIFSTNTVVREYKLVKTEPRLRHSMSKIFATDRTRKRVTYMIGNHMLAKLDLNIGESFIVNGRSSYFGLVIDKVNGVELN